MRFSAHPSLPRLPSCPERGEDRFECIRRGQMHVFELKDAMKGMRPANCISPEDEDRDTLLACAVLPDPSLSRFPVDRAWLRAPLSYARVSSAFARARCHAAGVSSSRGSNPSTQGRVARYDSCGNTSNR